MSETETLKVNTKLQVKSVGKVVLSETKTKSDEGHHGDIKYIINVY